MEREDAATPEAKSHRRLLVLGVVLVGTPVLLLVPSMISGVLELWPRTRAASEIISIRAAVCAYAIANDGVYPNSLEQLLTPDAHGGYYLDGFRELVWKDPWKREYHYTAPTPTHPEARIWSYGADGELGGAGDDADIDSDQIKEIKR